MTTIALPVLCTGELKTIEDLGSPSTEEMNYLFSLGQLQTPLLSQQLGKLIRHGEQSRYQATVEERFIKNAMKLCYPNEENVVSY